MPASRHGTPMPLTPLVRRNPSSAAAAGCGIPFFVRFWEKEKNRQTPLAVESPRGKNACTIQERGPVN